MAAQLPAPIVVVFGITGDLSKRKLLPALYHLLSQNMLPPETVIIGSSRRQLSIDSLLDTVELCVLETDNICSPEGLHRVKQSLQTIQLDPEHDDLAPLKQLIDNLDPDGQRPRLFYLSVPASAYPPIINQLAQHQLHQAPNRLLLEKPFGHDEQSAQALDSLLSQNFDEPQVYRIDHYLAKETAQNILAFRMHNPLFAAVWNGSQISRVHIRALERLDIEGRGNFYEQNGAVRDIIQSHLMQLLAITLMTAPADLSSQAIHQSKQSFLEGLLPVDPALAVRGQYQGYRQEAGNPDSTIETYAKVILHHQSPTWQGTEIVLETGKALEHKQTDVIIEFKATDGQPANQLAFQIQPAERINLGLTVRQPGLESSMQPIELTFDYGNAFEAAVAIDAYERVLIDALQGDQSLFASSPEVLATWHVLQPLLEAWADNGGGLVSYNKGSTLK